LDKYLMGNLEYPTDLMGVKEVHVFKYNDRPALQFQCQITILIKEPNAQCIRPQCAEPGGKGDGSGAGRKRRAVEQTTNNDNAVTIVDVNTQDFEILDITATNDAMLPQALRDSHLRSLTTSTENKEGICLTTTSFGLLLAMILLATFAAIVTTAYICCFHQNVSRKE